MATEFQASGRTKANRRRFTLLDGMIVVAATASGLGLDGWLTRIIDNEGAIDALDVLFSLLGARRYPQLAVYLMLMSFPVVSAWTLVLIPLGLIAPRPSLRRLARKPGWVACVSFAVALAFALVMLVSLVAVIGRPQSFALLEVSPMLPVLMAPAIAAVWLWMILGRRWRPEATWLDRSGRALGVFWILMAIVGPAVLASAFY